MADVSNAGDNIETSVNTILGIAAEGAITGSIIMSIVGQIIAFLLIIGISVTAGAIMKAVMTKLVISKVTIGNNTINDLITNSKINRLNMLNPLLINFKGSVDVNWLWKTDFSLAPNKPKTVPLAILTPPMISPIIAKRYNILTGKTNDFNLQMQSSTWN